jgi:hypothetical protein
MITTHFRLRFINANICHQTEKTRVEAGSNTSTVILRVVGGDEKGSLKSETVIFIGKIRAQVPRD